MKFREISEEKKKEIVKLVQDFKLDNEIFLQGGTLLGCVRENALIDNDDDIDISYISKYSNAEDIKKEMLEMYKVLIDKGIMIKYFDLQYKEIWDFNNLVEGRGQCHIKLNDFIIDLWTAWVDEEGYVNYCDIPKICKAEEFFPLRVGKIYDSEFNIPKNAEELLEKIYGVDWKIPQSKKPILERKGVLQ